MRLLPLAVLSVALTLLSSPVLAPAQTADPDTSSAAESPKSEPATGVQWFPDRFVIAALIAAPREVRFEGGLYSAERDLESEYEGSSLESEVAVGYRIPVVRLLDGGADGVALDLGFEAGVWSRFYMENRTRDLIATDYRVGAPLSLRYRAIEGRLTFHHMSSHLGDDYVAQFGLWVYQVSREALELVLAVRPVEPVRLYGGGDLNVGRGTNVAVDDEFRGQEFVAVEQWVLRFGAEYDPSWAREGSVQPFFGVNLETTETTRRLATIIRGGVAFRINSVRLLLDAQYRDGPSAMGQFRLDPEGFDNLDDPRPFRGVDERMFGVGLTIQIGGLVAPGPADRGL